jgi:hypothetical protein
MSALRRDEAINELSYAQKGVGMDGSCPLQIVMDHCCRTPADIAQLQRDFSSSGTIHTIKVQHSSHHNSSLVGQSREVLDSLSCYLSLSSHQGSKMESSSEL